MEQPLSSHQINSSDLLAKKLPDDPKDLDIASLEKDLKELESGIAMETEKNKKVIENLPSDAVARETQMGRNPRLKTWTELLEKKKTYEHVLNAMLFARRKSRQAVLAITAAAVISIGAATSYFIAKDGLAKELAQGRSDLEKKLQESNAALGAKDRELSERDQRLQAQAEDVAAKIRVLDEKAREAEARAKAVVEAKQKEVSELTRRLEEASKSGDRAEILKAVGNILQLFAAFDFIDPDARIGLEKVSDILNRIKEHFTPGREECGLPAGPFSQPVCGCFPDLEKLKGAYPQNFTPHDWIDSGSSAPIPRISPAEAPHVREAFEAIAGLWPASKAVGPRNFAKRILEANGYDENGRKRSMSTREEPRITPTQPPVDEPKTPEAPGSEKKKVSRAETRSVESDPKNAEKLMSRDEMIALAQKHVREFNLKRGDFDSSEKVAELEAEVIRMLRSMKHLSRAKVSEFAGVYSDTVNREMMKRK